MAGPGSGLCTLALAAALATATALLASCSPGQVPASPGSSLSEDAAFSKITPVAEATSSAVLTESLSRAIDPAGEDDFDVSRAMRDIAALSGLGVRRAGSAKEAVAAAWVANRLRVLGHEPRTEVFLLPNGKQSRNVFVVVPGTSTERLILGAHLDSKAPSPGANDDGSGVGVLLEIARLLKQSPPSKTVEIVFFGAEEISDSNPNHHHTGSRYRASTLSQADRAATTGMLSVDLLGYGARAYVRTMGVGPMSFADEVLAEGKRLGLPISYCRDPGSSGWSDHEPFERLGIPSAWLEWPDDPEYHKAGDTAGRLSRTAVRLSGRLILALAQAE